MSASAHKHRLIWFCETESLAADTDILRRLRDEIGLTTIMPESPVCHTSGFSASSELAAHGPFEDWRSRLDVWPRGHEGIFPPVAGVVSGFDDRPLRTLLEACARLGIEVWGHLGLWSYGGDVFPEFAMCDIDGRPLDRRYQRWGTGLCPSRREVNAWVGDCLVEITSKYGITAFCVDHARYPAPAHLHSLLGCGCDHCCAAAEALGFAFDSLRDGMRQWQQRVAGTSVERLRALIAARPSMWDFLAWLGEDQVIIRWLECRAALLAARMGEFRAQVRRVAGPEALFGSDVFAPSIALLGGHHYPVWENNVDFLTGGSSAGGVVGWASAVPNVAGEWAKALGAAVAGLQESEAFALVYRLFGYDDLGLAQGREALDQASLPVETIFPREVQRLRAATSDVVPLYPPISAQGPAEQVRSLCAAVRDSGCAGAMLGLDPRRGDILEIIAATLGATGD